MRQDKTIFLGKMTREWIPEFVKLGNKMVSVESRVPMYLARLIYCAFIMDLYIQCSKDVFANTEDGTPVASNDSPRLEYRELEYWSVAKPVQICSP